MNGFFKKRSATLRIVGIYALVSLFWIYTSDRLLGWIVPDPQMMVNVAIYKGSFFIILTSSLLYFLMGRYNRNLADSEHALKTNEIYLRTILDTEPDCVKLLDADCNLLMMNRAGLEMIEAESLEQVKGHCMCPLLIESYRDTFSALIKQVFMGIPGTLAYEFIGLKGRRSWFETHAVPFRNEGGEIVALLGITRDITEQKKAGAILNARVRLNEIAATATLDEILKAALDEAETLTGSTIGFFHFLEDDQVTLKLQAWSTRTLSGMCTAEAEGQHYSVDSAGVWVDSIRKRKPVTHNDYASLLHKKGLPPGHVPVIRELVVPVVRKNRIDAIIGVGNKPENYTDQDVDLLSQLASIACDIALRKKAEAALKESEERWKFAIEGSGDGVWDWDILTGEAKYSRRWKEMLGYEEDDILPSNQEWLDRIHPEDQAMVAEAMRAYLSGDTKIYVVEYRLKCKDESYRWILGRGMVVSRREDGSPLRMIGTHTDITERKRVEGALEESNRKLAALSVTDGLTGIANRRHFDEVLALEHARHARSGAELSLILLDIDHFKPFNDNYGHVCGDECLRQICRVIAESTVRPADLAARYGGEEFACILPETDQLGALLIAEKIRQGILRLAIPHDWSDVAECVSASLGVVTTHCSANTKASDIVSQADELLYRAKSRGRNRLEHNEAPPRLPQSDSRHIQLLWKDDYLSGNRLIDDQHQSLFRVANELLEAVLVAAPKEEISSTVTHLLDDVSQHFRDEERILESVGYPGLDKHVAEHAELQEKSLELAERFNTDTLEVGEIFQFLVYEVVMQHMLGADQEFFPFTRNLR